MSKAWFSTEEIESVKVGNVYLHNDGKRRFKVERTYLDRWYGQHYADGDLDGKHHQMIPFCDLLNNCTLVEGVL